MTKKEFERMELDGSSLFGDIEDSYKKHFNAAWAAVGRELEDLGSERLEVLLSSFRKKFDSSGGKFSVFAESVYSAICGKEGYYVKEEAVRIRELAKLRQVDLTGILKRRGANVIQTKLSRWERGLQAPLSEDKNALIYFGWLKERGYKGYLPTSQRKVISDEQRRED